MFNAMIATSIFVYKSIKMINNHSRIHKWTLILLNLIYSSEVNWCRLQSNKEILNTSTTLTLSASCCCSFLLRRYNGCQCLQHIIRFHRFHFWSSSLRRKHLVISEHYVYILHIKLPKICTLTMYMHWVYVIMYFWIFDDTDTTRTLELRKMLVRCPGIWTSQWQLITLRCRHVTINQCVGRCCRSLI